MLRITASRNANGAISYFREALSRQDYYAESKEVPGSWFGKAARLLGLKGEVGRTEFERLVNNRTPDGHTRLTVRDGKGRRAGYDFTWNAPKSASLVFALTGDEDILKAHRQAVRLAMQAVEANMQTQKGQGKNKQYVTTGNLLMASFDHFTSRPTVQEGEGGKIHVPDPHLHTHCFVFNGTWNEEKKRFQAVEVGTIKKEAPYYEALYHAHFSSALKEAGYEIEQTSDRWEIKGISREMIEKFSNRTAEINRFAGEKGLTWAEDKAAVGAKTRLKKCKSVAEAKLTDLWSQRLSAAELKAVLEARKGTAKQADKANRVAGGLTPGKAVDMALAHFLERKSVISEKRVLGKALSSGYGLFKPEEISAALAKRDDIVSAEKNGARLITTKEMIRQEDRMVASAARGKGQVPALHPEYKIRRDYLNQGQRDAIAHVLNTNDRISIVCGGAGTGKSTLFQEVRQAHEERGRSIFAFAPSAEASRGVLREKGFEDATTIASLLADREGHDKYRGQTLLIDEAGMVSIPDMNSIFDIAKQQDARVILSGDWRQHHSVQAGDALRIINERAGLKIAHVNEIVRQDDRSKYKSAIKALAQGKTEEGFEKLDRMGAIREVPGRDQRHGMVAEEYLRSVSARRSAIVVSPTHTEGKAVTEAIRLRLKEKGVLGKEENSFGTLRDLSLTVAEKSQAVSYRDGLGVQFCKPVAGFRLGGLYEVCGRDDKGQVMVRESGTDKAVSLPLDRAGAFQVYRREQTAIASGDQVRITKNGRTLDGSRLNNGQVLTIQGFDKQGNLQLSNGKTLARDYMNFTHGYYRTSYSAQGKDAQDVIISQSSESFAASNQKQFYVSVSRGTERCMVYTDDRERLKEAVKNPDERMSARDLLPSRPLDESRKTEQRRRIIDFYREQITRFYGQERGKNKPEQRVRTEPEPAPSRGFVDIAR